MEIVSPVQRIAKLVCPEEMKCIAWNADKITRYSKTESDAQIIQWLIATWSLMMEKLVRRAKRATHITGLTAKNANQIVIFVRKEVMALCSA
jgi:hypothetical protein